MEPVAVEDYRTRHPSFQQGEYWCIAKALCVSPSPSPSHLSVAAKCHLLRSAADKAKTILTAHGCPLLAKKPPPALVYEHSSIVMLGRSSVLAPCWMSLLLRVARRTRALDSMHSGFQPSLSILPELNMLTNQLFSYTCCLPL